MPIIRPQIAQITVMITIFTGSFHPKSTSTAGIGDAVPGALFTMPDNAVTTPARAHLQNL